MLWAISEDKKAGILAMIDKLLLKNTCSLEEIQKLHGKLSDFAQACEFMKGFRSNIVNLLQKFEHAPTEGKLISAAVKKDLQIWRNCIDEAVSGFPLGDVFVNPTLFPITFVSDAAGAVWEWTEKGRVNRTVTGDRGAASVGHRKGEVHSIALIKWPDEFILRAKSSERLFFGSKSATLETVGLLLPFLAFPSSLAGQQILLEVDNISVVYGWEKRYSKNDPETSLLIRCLHVIEAFLECKIYVRHLRRMSNRTAALADSLSREITTTREVQAEIAGAKISFPAGALMQWLKKPGLDWDLPLKLVDDIKKQICSTRTK
jgi:hypothetical protein